MTSFQLPDPYDGWSEEELKKHCRRLARAYDTYQQIVLVLADQGIGGLPPKWLEKVRRLQEAYSDD